MAQVIQIKLSLSNAYLVIGERPILIDAGSPNESEKIVAALAKHNLRGEDIALLLLTHGHVDHAGSAAALKRRFGMPVALHSADADMVIAGKNRHYETIGMEAAVINRFLPSEFPALTPDVALDGAFKLSEYGVRGQVIDTPGHTAGSVSIVLDDGNAIAGDILRGGYMGGNLLSQRPLYHYFAEEFSLIDQSISKLLAHNPHTLHVGHGGPLSAEIIHQKFSVSA